MKRGRPAGFKSTSGAAAPFKKPRKAGPAFNPPRSKISHPEKKNVDVNINLQPPLSNAWIAAATLLNPLSQGASPDTRVGRKVNYTSMEFKWSATLDPTSVGGSPIRSVVVYDKQANGAIPGPTDVFETDDFTSPLNLGNSERFVVLMDLITEPLSVNNNFSVAGKEYRTLNLDQIFNLNNNGDITDITSGSITCWVSQTGSITVGQPTFQIYSRLRFIDN